MDFDRLPAGQAMDRAVADALGFRVTQSYDRTGYELLSPSGKPLNQPRPNRESAWDDLPFHFSTDFMISLSALEKLAEKYRIERTPDRAYHVQVTLGHVCPPHVESASGESLPIAICRAIIKGTQLG